MPALSRQSLDRLSTCHIKLQELITQVSKKFDLAVLCGHRNKQEQDKAVLEGRSKVQYPNSKHNILPSLAVDIAPWPLDWNDVRRFYYLIGYTRGVADKLGIQIRVGADWNGNGEIKDQNFHDLPHIELIE